MIAKFDWLDPVVRKLCGYMGDEVRLVLMRWNACIFLNNNELVNL